MGKFYRLNLNISVPEVRLIDPTGNQIGVVPTREALQKARESGLDLVEIAPNAKPPVAKIIDFKKFKYEEAKRERVAKKKTKETETKEVWLGPHISEHDLETRLGRARQFLTAGDRVKLSVRFSGREMAYPEFGHQVLNKSKEKLADIAKMEYNPRFEGRNLGATFVPIK